MNEYLLPPLPITLYTRDTTCWIYGGVTLNPLYWPARHEETILTTSIYKFHPDFAGKVKVWWGDPHAGLGLATLEGGDVMPIGKGNVLIGMSERTSRQAISQAAAALFAQGAAERVIIAAMPKLRAAMHLDTVSPSPTATACCSIPTSSTRSTASPTARTERAASNCGRTRAASSRRCARH